MPYAATTALPDRFCMSLPHHAQDIFRAAFNDAYEQYGPRSEALAFRVAWAAVKQSYVQRGKGIWIARAARA